MRRRIEERMRINHTEGPKDSRKIIEGTTPILDVTHVIRKVTLQETSPKAKGQPSQTRRRDIMHILLKMMTL